MQAAAPQPKTILVVYHCDDAHPRLTVLEHLYSFRRYSRARCVYLNTAALHIPVYFRRLHVAAVVFHYSFMSQRMAPVHFARLMDKIRFLAEWPVPKAVVAQDEYLHGDGLCAFIRTFGVRHVFSCATASDWPRIYRDVDMSKLDFQTVLTGYVDAQAVSRVNRRARRVGRDIDIGYRSWFPWPSLGRHAQMKGEIGLVVQAAAGAAGVTTDIETGGGSGGNTNRHSLLGSAWMDFLLRCRYTLGVEGGASVLDFDGAVQRRTLAFLAAHPKARFDEVEAACFPGEDGALRYFALSPRHLEACVCRTGQILLEGTYNGVLRPGEHYLELRRDYSNLQEVLAMVSDEPLRESMVERAYRDIVESGAWSYQVFVDRVLRAFCEEAPSRDERGRQRVLEQDWYVLRSRIRDWTLWRCRVVRSLVERVIGAGRVTHSMARLERLLFSARS